MSRPDTLDLIGAAYDSAEKNQAERTLVICSAPRTGSYELCRLLTAAGIGTPHEYFNSNYAEKVAPRWGLEGDPLSGANIGAYTDALRTRRVQGGVFATKLQFWQYEQYLQNPSGAALLEDAAFVHLFRPDVVQQFRSLRAAMVSGRWDFGERASRPPQPDSVKAASGSLELLLREDAGFRRLFVLFDKTPLFLTTDDVVKRPRDTVERIASLIGVESNPPALEDTLATSAPYERDHEIDRLVCSTIETLRRAQVNPVGERWTSAPNLEKQIDGLRQKLRDSEEKLRESREQAQRWPLRAEEASKRSPQYVLAAWIGRLPWLGRALRRRQQSAAADK